MKLRNQELMEEFYDRMLPNFPSLTLEDMTNICHNQYKYTRDCIEGNEIVEIRLKYLGSFQVYEGRARNYLYNLKEQLKYRKIEPKVFQRLSKLLTDYLEKLEKKNGR